MLNTLLGRGDLMCREFEYRSAGTVPETVQEGNHSGTSAQAFVVCQHCIHASHPLLSKPIDCLQTEDNAVEPTRMSGWFMQMLTRS